MVFMAENWKTWDCDKPKPRCPVCGSLNINVVRGIHDDFYLFECYACGYIEKEQTMEEKFVSEEFSALNQDKAKKYIGKIMEFADIDDLEDGKWVKSKLQFANIDEFPFDTGGGDCFHFCRTCRETFQDKQETIKRYEKVWNMDTGATTIKEVPNGTYVKYADILKYLGIT